MTHDPITARARCPVAVPADDVDLGAWLAGLGDAEYREASVAHLGLGRASDGEGFLSVESFSGLFVFNRHRYERLERHRFVSRSPRSRAYLTRTRWIEFEVRWTATFTPDGPGGAIESELALSFGRRLHSVARRSFVPRRLQAHLEEELPHFARGIERRALVPG